MTAAGPMRLSRCLEIDPNETSVGTIGGQVRNRRPNAAPTGSSHPSVSASTAGSRNRPCERTGARGDAGIGRERAVLAFGGQDDDGDGSRRPLLVFDVAVLVVLVDDLPQARVVGIVGQHRSCGDSETPWPDVDLDVGLGLQVVVPARGLGRAALGCHDQIVVTVAGVGQRRRPCLPVFAPTVCSSKLGIHSAR